MDNNGKAIVLVQSCFTSDKDAARKFGTCERTIRRWRAELLENPDMMLCFQQAYKAAATDWGESLNGAILEAIATIRRACTTAGATSDPATLLAVVEALKALAHVQMSKRILDVRLAVPDEARIGYTTRADNS